MTDNRTIISYRIPDLAPAVLGTMAVAGVVALVLSVMQGGPVLFVLLFLVTAVWNAYNFLVRSAHAVAITDRTLFWTNYLETVEVDMHEVVRMTLGFGGWVQVIECRDGRKLRVPIMQGYLPFIEAVAQHYPQLDIERGRYSRFVDRVQLFRPDRSGDADPSRGQKPPTHR